MRLRDEVIQVLEGHTEGMTDAELAERLGKLHQQVNQRCRQLATEGLLVRDSASGTIVNRLVRSGGAVSSQSAPPPTTVRSNPTAHPWPHEVAVQGALVGWLVRDNWRILRVADTEAQEQGTDVIADRDGVRLMVEVKGYPGSTYGRGPKAGEPKPTPSTLQASHWLATALLRAMRMRGADQDSRIVIALPDATRYGALLSEIDHSLRGARIEAWLLTDRGEPSARFGAWPD
ncbi:hypothetical protein ACFPJ1_02395 [Kribbella qitaiheensis]|uniref:hypothetical protein n=1 Tax=Kribbella qitaiheensis TaxID=1544730 RepID=UPI00361721FA